VVEGEEAFLNNGSIVGIGDPNALIVNGTISVGVVAVHGSRGYMATVHYCSLSGECAGIIHAVDLANRQVPPIVGEMALPTPATCMRVSNDLAYVGVEDGGLVIIDVSSPSTPLLVSTLDTPIAIWGISVSEPYVLAAAGNAGVHVIDVTDTANPALIATVPIPGFVHDVAVSGSYAFVISSDLYVIDMGNPSAPTIVASLDIPGGGTVMIDNARAYVACGGCPGWNHGIQIIDVANPEEPVLMGHANFGANCIVAEGDVAVASFPTNGPRFYPEVRFYDVSDPAQPVSRGGFASLGEPDWLVLRSNVAYIATYGGLFIVDVSQQEPRFLGSIAVPFDGNPWELASVDLDGDYAFIAHGRTFSVLPAQCSETAGIGSSISAPVLGLVMSVRPNPASERIGIFVDATMSDIVTVEVFDLSGRLVRRLYSGRAPAGAIRLEWDRKNDREHRVASGTYFVRAKSLGAAATSKAIVLGR
jgi:hypothetical protein